MVLINEWKPKLVLLAETHVTDEVLSLYDVSDSELHIDHYRIEQCVTASRRTGGVMALVQEGINYKCRISECTQKFVWLLTIEVCAVTTYFFTVLYRSPQKENGRFVEYFAEHLEKMSDYDGVNVIFGDFNFDLLKPSFYGDKLLQKIYLKRFTL